MELEASALAAHVSCSAAVIAARSPRQIAQLHDTREARPRVG